MNLAIRYEIISGKIQLFDKDNNKLRGRGTKWDGNFYCSDNNLTTLEGAPESVGGGFFCSNNNLTTLEGAPESVGGGFFCSNNNLTTLEGAPESVGGDFYCYNDNLTTLEGAPESVGGSFYCYNDNLTTLDGAPKERQCMFNPFYKQGYVFADGILTRLVSEKNNSGVIIYKTRKLGTNKLLYVVKDGVTFSHGETAKKALADLAFKAISRDTTQFKNMPLDTIKSPQEWAFVYRAITGACQAGIEEFIKSKGKIKKKYQLSEILEETKGSYGYDKFIDGVK